MPVLKQSLSFFIALISVHFITTTPAQARAFWEVTDYGLKMIATVKGARERAFVAYNPALCEQAGDACGFFRDQMHGHLVLRDTVIPSGNYLESDIMLADCWVADTGRPHEIKAAYELMLQADSAEKFSLKGDLNRRAENLRNCAIKSNNWMGDS